MKSYIEMFAEAIALTNTINQGMSNYPLQIITDASVNLKMVVAAIAKDFSEFMPGSEILPGRCFWVVRELSYVLFDLGIRHTVTIGDIELAEGMYTGATAADLLDEISEGYQYEIRDGAIHGKPAKGHAWITLESGDVIDGTILASQHRKLRSAAEPLPLNEAIFYTGKPGTPMIRHIPMLTGLIYHQKVLIGEHDGFLAEYCQWSEDYGRLMSRLDLMRAVPFLTTQKR
ncbi:hypothetical protein IB229_13120 [Pseudomonas sp. PDM14]|uniref:hypothetical protein n=1 Tax=Pseudomonas sp. PDM14 TaxID=2769288 RepID=UPI001782D312|nr:hypothetical protein [Pseudomonas sp. PDM14]MBD9483921.1 hypothetical protein [Pseudomonas sp. PDM14]